MELIRIGNTDADKIAPLVAAFRTQLKSCKGIKSQPGVALQYGGTCKKIDSLECSGIDSEAYYQVDDGSVFAIYGEETSLFKKSADYNFYSVRRNIRCIKNNHKYRCFDY